MSTIAPGTGSNTAACAGLRAELLEAIRDLEHQLRRLRRSLEGPRTPRDLAAEIERLLDQTPALTTPEVAQAITARESAVRTTLKEHPERFSACTGVPGRSPQARCWNLTRRPSATQPKPPAESLEVRGG